MILDKYVKTRWHSVHKSHYEEKGYLFTKIGDEFEVKVEDLKSTSQVKVKYQCDYCLGENQLEEKEKYKTYEKISSKNIGEKDCCRKCKGRKVSELALNAEIKKEESLGLNYPELIKEWSEKNEKTPYDYLPKSAQTVWWVCENGHEWDAKIGNRTSLNRGCPFCSGQRVHEDNCLGTKNIALSEEWNHRLNGGLTPYDVTESATRKVWWTCRKCNHEWESKISNRKHGRGCPNCNESKGEKKVRNYLNKYNLNFKAQYEFEGLVGLSGNPLKFDFALFDENNSLLMLIEYDGEFHYRKIYEQDGYDRIKLHDSYKNEFCEKMNIQLLRIPYWEFNSIESTLLKNLNIYE